MGAVTLKTNGTLTAGFVANAYSADFSGCEEIRAAVAGQSIYIERIVINTLAAEIITIGAGETGGAVTAVVIGPIYTGATSTHILTFSRPIKITAATALVVDAAGAGETTVIVQGFVK